MNKPLQSKRKGSVMALMMVALVVLLVTGTGLLSLGLQSRIHALQAASDIAARCAADAGLTKALFEMNKKLKVKPWSNDTIPHTTDGALPNCDAIFSYNITEDSNSVYTIESTGNYGRAERKVSGTLRFSGLVEYAIFAEDGMELKNGTTVDGYNFDTADENLQIGTNSTEAGSIDSKLGVTINGDVAVGFGGDPAVVIDSQDEAVITGDTYALSEPHKLDPITVPQYLVELPALPDPDVGTTTITGSAKYGSFDLGNGQIIEIDGPTTLYILGDLILDNSAQLQIVSTNPDASLTLYLGGNFECKNGGLINNLAQDAQKLKIYGLDTCQEIDFKTSSTFYGAIYAPNADVTLHNSVAYNGAVATKSFTQMVNADFNYDASLRDASINDEGVRFVVQRWHEE